MKRRANKHNFKPTMEALEARWCPSTAVSPLQHGAITITGDDHVNIVQITQNDNQNRLTVIADGVTTNFTSDQVTTVVIDLKGGNDQLTYQLGGGSNFDNGKRIKVDLGSGDDTATFNFADNGSGGLATVHSLNLDIQAQDGKDHVDAVFGRVNGSDHLGTGVTLTGNMGFGDDHFTALIKAHEVPADYHYGHGPRPGYAPSLNIDVEDMNDLVIRDPLHPTTILATISGGNDDFRVTSEAGVLTGPEDNIDVGVTLKGGDGKDHLEFQSQTQLHGNLTLLIDGQDGNDTVLVNIQPTTHSTGNIDATVLGSNGDDMLTLRIGNLTTGTVLAVLDGGNGFDNFNKSLNVTDKNCEIGVFF